MGAPRGSLGVMAPAFLLSQVITAEVTIIVPFLSRMSIYFPHIIHLDADAFFASCEEAMDHRLIGKPVVVGQERGMVTALNINAKRLGIVRGLPIFQVKRMCPSCVILSGNYRAYSMFSARMARITKRFASVVERYSVDECFADVLHDVSSLDEAISLARTLSRTLQEELGITFSVGLAPTKTLAKIASKWNKPAGFTVIERSSITSFLDEKGIEEVWGIGPALSQKLKGLGVMTALAFKEKSHEWVAEHVPHKHERSLWHELRGEIVSAVHEQTSMPSSTQSFKSFRAQQNLDVVYAHLVTNLERATKRLRHMGLFASRASFHVRDHRRMRKSIDVQISPSSSNPDAFITALAKRKREILVSSVMYTQTGVSLYGLSPYPILSTLFGEEVSTKKWQQVYTSVDGMNSMYGSGTILLGASMALQAVPSTHHRSLTKMAIADAQGLAMPYLGEVS